MDAAVIDAAKVMVPIAFQLLHVVQMPLALPFAFASIQTAVVQSTVLATLAAGIGGGFGDWILQGLAPYNVPRLLAGAVPFAVMAMTAKIALCGSGALPC